MKYLLNMMCCSYKKEKIPNHQYPGGKSLRYDYFPVIPPGDQLYLVVGHAEGRIHLVLPVGECAIICHKALFEAGTGNYQRWGVENIKGYRIKILSKKILDKKKVFM